MVWEVMLIHGLILTTKKWNKKMLKKITFLMLCLSLSLSPLAQTQNNVLDGLSSHDIKSLTQTVQHITNNLSDEEKTALLKHTVEKSDAHVTGLELACALIPLSLIVSLVVYTNIHKDEIKARLDQSRIMIAKKKEAEEARLKQAKIQSSIPKKAPALNTKALVQVATEIKKCLPEEEKASFNEVIESVKEKSEAHMFVE